MGKMKEVFLRHQQEHEEEYAKYYSEMYKVAEYMGVEVAFNELHKSTIEIKDIINPKKKKNDRKKQ